MTSAGAETGTAGLVFQVGAGGDYEFELFGPAAHVDSQTAARSQWVREALDSEGMNFLAFLKAEIEAKKTAGTGVGGTEGGDGKLEDDESLPITFEVLLPPRQHSKVVAAQGLLHVLSLATKGLVRVRQHEVFGKIEIAAVSGVKWRTEHGSTQEAEEAVEVSGGDEDTEDVSVGEGSGGEADEGGGRMESDGE